MPSIYDRLDEVDVGGERFTQEIPLGPIGEICSGKLDNGLSYYVRKCQKPKDRVAIALAVRIGSVAEEDTEQGVAHILEHLAFNATEKYSNHEIVKFLESIGAEFGACQNAYTSADETVFQLVVPTDKPELLERALEVLAEFAFGIRCAPQDLKKERGAVLEEWRMTRDAAGRAQEAHWKLIMKGSKYADRLPIGTEAVIRGVSSEVVKGFFDRWYRPELMAVSVVGDVEDEEVAVDLIKRYLSRGKCRIQDPPPLPSHSYEAHVEPRFKVTVDKEAQESTVFLCFKVSCTGCMTPEQFLEQLKEMVFENILTTRLFKLSRGNDPPFVSAAVAKEPLTTTVQSYTLTAAAMMGGKGAVLMALESLLMEVARVRVHGFSLPEYDRAIKAIKATTECTYLERDQNYCWDLRDEYLRHFLNHEFVSGQEYEARLTKTLLPMLNKEMVAELASAYHPSKSCVIKVVEHKVDCTELEISSVVNKVVALEKDGKIQPWQDEGNVPDCLIPETEMPSPGVIVSERSLEGSLSATELLLGNGMRVCFKSTDFLHDEVLISGFAFGGLSEVPEAQFVTARATDTIADQLGVFGYKPAVMADLMAGKKVQMDIAETAFFRQLSGAQSPSDLEDAMQLIHLLFKTNLTVDGPELAVMTRILKQSIEAQLRNPAYEYAVRVSRVNYGDCYYFKAFTLDDLKVIDPNLACEMHNKRFKNPAEFTLVLTGKIDREALIPLVEKYLASIPSCPLPPGTATTTAGEEGLPASSPTHDNESDHLDHQAVIPTVSSPSVCTTQPDAAMTEVRVAMSQQQQGLSGDAAPQACSWPPPPSSLLSITNTHHVIRSPSQVKPLPVDFPHHPVVEDVKVHMVSPVTQTQITFPVVLERSLARELLVWLGLALRILETRLLQQLRFKYGEIYTVSVNQSFACDAPSNSSGDLLGLVSVSYSCDPANRHRLREMTLKALQEMQESEVAEEEILTVKNLERLQFENELQENQYWHGVILSAYKSRTYQLLGDIGKVYDLNLLAREKVLLELSPSTLKEVMCKLFHYPCGDRYTAISMVPEQHLLSRLMCNFSQVINAAASSLLGLSSSATAGALRVNGAESSTLGTASLDDDDEMDVDMIDSPTHMSSKRQRKKVSASGLVLGGCSEDEEMIEETELMMGSRSPPVKRVRMAVGHPAAVSHNHPRGCSSDCPDRSRAAHDATAGSASRLLSSTTWGGGSAAVSSMLLLGAGAAAVAVMFAGFRAWQHK
ncbi:hypothetical protein CEUSTIGMA_g8878.t1 [Chlamydomonas eustigma]|uniref:Peptidase M16 N-terminal domain-containing protein n=1 Tax=Chlamydomonas eustigma TaxID=1157962 RepID=A0A250XEU5_9CHLO|nr:hypothetical protein CEUSTIGMA_g8878.t1 [Chlamydomonas eustigma]|eukprot:GAX81449.1 hypothetical protein CEUSTIGMA_g8878.t1 [Chlamydomonas eustigma]